MDEFDAKADDDKNVDEMNSVTIPITTEQSLESNEELNRNGSIRRCEKNRNFPKKLYWMGSGYICCKQTRTYNIPRPNCGRGFLNVVKSRRG